MAYFALCIANIGRIHVGGLGRESLVDWLAVDICIDAAIAKHLEYTFHCSESLVSVVESLHGGDTGIDLGANIVIHWVGSISITNG